MENLRKREAHVGTILDFQEKKSGSLSFFFRERVICSFPPLISHNF